MANKSRELAATNPENVGSTRRNLGVLGMVTGLAGEIIIRRGSTLFWLGAGLYAWGWIARRRTVRRG